VDLTPELLLSWTRRGPRYTSYPTVPEWKDELPDSALSDAIERIEGRASVYVHVPFCREQCSFCGCTMVVSGRREPGRRYLDALKKQLQSLRFSGGKERLEVVRIHFGGGTPTWFSPDELTELWTALRTRFAPIEGAELSVEVDPEVTTDEHVDALAAAGVTRLSLGVQSFDDTVLAAVNRPQARDRVRAVFERARQHGMRGLNLDLIYGLPFQTAERFSATLAETLAMRPDRLALFGYAHVPWLKPHQKKIDAATLPGPVDRAQLFLDAHAALLAAGYVAIGMDHFALPDDELALARKAGTLHRNFMGYTTHSELPLIGLGMSAISEFPDLYVQQRTKLSRWWKAIEAGDEPLIEKAGRVSAADRLRRDAIQSLMCNLKVDLEAVARRHGADPFLFDADLARMDSLEADGLVRRSGRTLVVPDDRALLVRNVAMVLDPRMSGEKSSGPRYSSTV
jgi:oxygen-independent coproporphyrinogen-3 oxidase